MDILEYKKKVLKELKEMSTEEFYDVLRNAGVNCSLEKEEENEK